MNIQLRQTQEPKHIQLHVPISSTTTKFAYRERTKTGKGYHHNKHLAADRVCTSLGPIRQGNEASKQQNTNSGPGTDGRTCLMTSQLVGKYLVFTFSGDIGCEKRPCCLLMFWWVHAVRGFCSCGCRRVTYVNAIGGLSCWGSWSVKKELEWELWSLVWWGWAGGD